MRIVIGAALLLSFCTNAEAGLIHRYSFDDGTANDAVGSANGILVNGATVTGGQLTFSPTVNDGVNKNPATGQYVDLPANIAHTRAMTLETWFTFRGGNNWQRILDFGNSSAGRLLPTDRTTTGYSGTAYTILTPVNGRGQILGQISINSAGHTGDTNFVAPGLAVSQNVEHQLVFTHNPDTQVEALYLDGVLRGQVTATVDPSTTKYLNWFLGRSNFAGDPFFNGTIDEFRVYDTALSSTQSMADFQAGPSVLVPEPVSASAALIFGAILITSRRQRKPD
jgi:hypothetical protein